MQFLCRFPRQLHHHIYTHNIRHVSNAPFIGNRVVNCIHGHDSLYSPFFHLQSATFSSANAKDESKSESTDTSPSQSIEENATTTESAITENTASTAATSESTESVETTSSSTDGPIPLIRIHDENSPQLSISLPNRWPFKRLARTKPVHSLSLYFDDMKFPLISRDES